MLLLIAVSSFATIALATVALLMRSPNPVRARALAIGGGLPLPEHGTADTLAARIARPLGGHLVKMLPHRWFQRLDRLIVVAGEPISTATFALLWAVVVVGAATVGLSLGSWWILICMALGGYAPLLWLRRTADKRRRQISKDLPDAIDLLVTCVEAGLGLDAALMRVGDATEGPLGSEIRRTLREVAVGRARQDALLDLATRSNVSDLESVIRPIVQAERSGVSIASAMRIQAESLRLRRRQRAQEAAQKIPAKMTLVIAAFFIPTVMLIAVAPAVFRLLEFFSGDVF